MAKILIVDDDLDSAANAADFLTYEKHSIEVVHTGGEGWDKASAGQYDWWRIHNAGLLSL